MCGRFTQAYAWQEVFEIYSLTGQPRILQPNYNVAPTQMVNVIVAGNAGWALQDVRWGLVPSWWKKSIKDLPSTFNAPSETAHEKPMFRTAFKHSRCLVPASGFYEWKRSGDSKRPYHISMADGTPMTFAGLWDSWRDPKTGEDLRSCTILTTTPNSFMKAIHNRMPVILEADQFCTWIGEGSSTLLKPCHNELLTAHHADKSVGNVRNNGPELLDRKGNG